MIETYVYCEGGKPKDVFTDRLEALTRLTSTTDGPFRLSEREIGMVKRALDVGIPLHEPLLVVGYEVGQGWLKDRSITRVK